MSYDDGVCQKSDNGTVKVVVLKIAQLSHTDVECYGGEDGTITVLANDGIEPYQYKLEGSTNTAYGTYSTTNTFTGLSAGDGTSPGNTGTDEYGETVYKPYTIYANGFSFTISGYLCSTIVPSKSTAIVISSS